MQQFFVGGAPKPVSASSSAAAARGLFEAVVSGSGDPSPVVAIKAKPSVAKTKPAAAAAGSEDDSGDDDYKPGMVEEEPASDEDDGEEEEVEEDADGNPKKPKVPSCKRTYAPSKREIAEYERNSQEVKGYMTEKQSAALTLSDNPVYILDAATGVLRYLSKGKDAEGEDEYLLFRGAEMWTFNTHKGLHEWCVENSIAVAQKPVPKTKPLICEKCKKPVTDRLAEAKRQAMFYSLDEAVPDQKFYRQCVETMSTTEQLIECADCFGAPPVSEFKEGFHGVTELDAEDTKDQQLLESTLQDSAGVRKQKKTKRTAEQKKYDAEVEMQETAAIVGDKYAGESDEDDRSDNSDISLGSDDEAAAPTSKNLKVNQAKQEQAEADRRQLEEKHSALYSADVKPFATVEHGIPAHLIPNVISRVKMYMAEKVVRSDPVRFAETKKDTHAHKVLGAMIHYYVLNDWHETLLEAMQEGAHKTYVTPANGILRAREAAVLRELTQNVRKSEFKEDPVAFLVLWPGKNDPVYKVLSQLVKVYLFKCDRDRVLGFTAVLPDDSSKAGVIAGEEKRVFDREESREARELQSKRRADPAPEPDQPVLKKHKPAAAVQPVASPPPSHTAPPQAAPPSPPRPPASPPKRPPVAPVETTSVLRSSNGVAAALPVRVASVPRDWLLTKLTDAVQSLKKGEPVNLKEAEDGPAESVRYNGTAKKLEEALVVAFEAGRKAEKEHILNDYLSCIVCTEPLIGLQLSHCGHGMCYRCRRERKIQNLDFKCAECKEPVGDHPDYIYFKHFDLVQYVAGLKDKSIETYRRLTETETSRSEIHANFRAITSLLRNFQDSGSRRTKRMKIEGGAEEMERSIVEWKKEFSRRLKATEDITVYNGYLHVHRMGFDVSRLKMPTEEDG